MNKFAENQKVLPILAPQDITETTTYTQYVDLKTSNWAQFLVSFGNIAGDASTVSVEASTAASSNATEATVPFRYRLSAAIGTDTMGAITAGTSDGVSMTTSDDNKTLVIDVDPAALATNPGADFRFLRVKIAPASSSATATLVNAIAILSPRYPGNSIPSAT
jgi:hypothetical protein